MMKDQPNDHRRDQKREPSEFSEGASIDRFSQLEPLDQEILDSLRLHARKGQPSLLEKVIPVYLQSSPKLIEAIRAAISLDDASEMQKAAHSLKSSSGNLGAVVLADICKELEIAGRAGTTAGCDSFLHALEGEYERVCEALKKELEETENPD